MPGDLTLMANQGSQPVTDLAVSEVLHKTYEKVGEVVEEEVWRAWRGTGGAAAAAAQCQLPTAAPRPHCQVDEMGTEASAVTVIAVGTSAPIETK